jgi:hypothetical protein
MDGSPTLRIDGRYTGPPGSANGGIAAGLLAAHVDAPVVEVTLRRPPPLDTDLRVEAGSLYDGATLIASAVAGTVDVEVHPPVSVEVARASATSYAGNVDHPFRGCYVCGTDREPPDGLGLRPGPIGAGAVAGVWTPTGDEPFLVWAALDCPAGWASDLPGRPMVLGRMALERRATPVVGEPHVVVGWTRGNEGRKTFSASALYDADGQLLALARSTWFAVDVAQMGLPS